MGTGSYSSAVTWSAVYGAITSAGVYTAPATVPTSGMDTITATSTQDGTKSGQANITITAARVITFTPQYPTVSQAEAAGGIFPVQINATGIQAGDVIETTEMGISNSYSITATDVTNGYFTVDIGINEIASFVRFACGSPTSTNAMCNTAWMAITTDQQELAENSGATMAYFNPGYTFDIQEFSLANEANEGAAPLVGSVANSNSAIAVDGGTSGTGALVSDVEFEAVNSTTGTATTGIIAPGNPVVVFASIAARNGYGYMTEPDAGYLGRFTISTTAGLGSPSTVAAGSGPYAMDAATVNAADAIVVYSGVDRKARLFSNALTLESTSAALSNITAFPTNGQPLTGSQGGWPLRIIGSGSAAGTVGVLSSYDNVLDFLTISSGNVLSWAGAALGSVTLTGNPYLIAPDPTHGAFIVASADTTNGVTTLQSISAKSPYTATTITSASSLPVGFLASGILVSNDGSTIYVAGFNALTAPDPTNTPLFIAIANN